MKMFAAFAALALALPAPAGAAEQARPPATTQAKAKPKPRVFPKPRAKAEPAKAEDEPVKTEAEAAAEAERMAAVARVADWIAASGDNGSLPYAIVDKKAAALLLFNAKGKRVAKVPVLIGVAVGDDATPGVGSKNLAEIGPAEKTTPAGRFLARYGLAGGRQRVLWVDYATSVALHPIPPTASKKERRRQRMLSPTPEDNRITFGCINVPVAFYGKDLQPLFRRKGGYVYVLPDTKPIEEVFPRLRVQAVAGARG